MGEWNMKEINEDLYQFRDSLALKAFKNLEARHARLRKAAENLIAEIQAVNVPSLGAVRALLAALAEEES